ncbi:hypothetical protein KUTeg_015618 [Tegillarca granosa]|uniref:C2H2-type domain-containing protein n=1 Tax=Tegillarca granosa TaxID=220873 RepID=A0ABQ9EQP5_TEGGR|nr:hypothetical protein KUTeg_015618 [Tegillarca granosa]
MNKDSVKEKSVVEACDSVGQISENSKINMGIEDAGTSTGVNSESVNGTAYNSYISQMKNSDNKNNDHRISHNDNIEKHYQDRDAESPDVVMYDDMEDDRENNSDSGIVLSPSPHLANRTCEFCGVIKQSPADLHRHLRKHTGERPFICGICNRGFKAKRSLQKHQILQHMHKMVQLGQSSVIAQYPDGSLALKHKLDTLYNPEASQSKRFRSDDENHGDQDSVSSNSPIGSLRESPESGIEITENGRDRVCHICGKVCLKPSDLRRHMMCHTGEKPFKCDICGKPFRAKNSMHYHMKASHGVNVELSPGLQERYMRLKKQSRAKTLVTKLDNLEQDSGNTNSGPDIPHTSNSDSDSTNFTSKSSFHYNKSTPCKSNIIERTSDTPSLDDLKNEMLNNACSISNFTDGKAVLDPETGLFKHLGYYIDPSNIPESDNDGTIQLVKPGKSLIGTEIVQESPFCKSRISVKNETVLVTRIDGINLVSGNETSLFKCYLCGKVFNHLAQIQCHLSMHFEKDIVVYECQICHDTFWFKFQVVQHIRKKHPNELRNRSLSSSKPADIKTEISDDENTFKHSSNENPDTSSEKSLNENQEESFEKTSENVSSENMEQEDVNDQSNQTEKESILCQLYRGLKYRKNSNGSYICVICRKSFFREQSLLKHIQIHSGKSLYYCEDCGHGFDVYSHLRQHIIQVHGSKTNIDTKSESITRSLLSTLLKKTNQNWSPTAPVLSQEIEKEKENLEKEKAKAFLESEGIKEDIEVVLPCDPEESQMDKVDQTEKQKNWSESESETENEDENQKDVDGKNSEIMMSPRTTMLSKLTKVLNKRKSKMPIHIKQEAEATTSIEKKRGRSSQNRKKFTRKPDTSFYTTCANAGAASYTTYDGKRGFDNATTDLTGNSKSSSEFSFVCQLTGSFW